MKLFESIPLGKQILKNRIVMPPMTRSRSTQPGDIPNDLMAEYYSQRSQAGLMITEGTQISELGKGYAWTPGIYTPEQVEGWKRVTTAVHKNSGVIYAQLWHVGRVSHPDNTGGLDPIAPSAIAAQGVRVFVEKDGNTNFVEAVTPREMSKADIVLVISQFQAAAKNALKAGFDGVELHAANGYLINQFIDSQSNQRKDEYGGTLVNRLRFLFEVANAVAEIVGPDRVGVRVAPLTTLNGTVDDNPEETYVAVAKLLSELNIGYMHIAEADWDDAPDMPLSFRKALRDAFNGKIIYAGKYDKHKAEKALQEGWADMIGFGRPFVSNPDLPYRFRHDLDLQLHDPNTLFGEGREGYTDYPTVT